MSKLLVASLAFLILGLPGAILGVLVIRRRVVAMPPLLLEWLCAWVGAMFGMVLPSVICLGATGSTPFDLGKSALMFSMLAGFSASAVEVFFLFLPQRSRRRFSTILWAINFSIVAVAFAGSLILFDRNYDHRWSRVRDYSVDRSNR